jgi:hypothetical protein
MEFVSFPPTVFEKEEDAQQGIRGVLVDYLEGCKPAPHGKNMTLVEQVQTMLGRGGFESEVAEDEETTAIPCPRKSSRRCDAVRQHYRGQRGQSVRTQWEIHDQ